jgi:hypothetical protein
MSYSAVGADERWPVAVEACWSPRSTWLRGTWCAMQGDDGSRVVVSFISPQPGQAACVAPHAYPSVPIAILGRLSRDSSVGMGTSMGVW